MEGAGNEKCQKMEESIKKIAKKRVERGDEKHVSTAGAKTIERSENETARSRTLQKLT